MTAFMKSLFTVPPKPWLGVLRAMRKLPPTPVTTLRCAPIPEEPRTPSPHRTCTLWSHSCSVTHATPAWIQVAPGNQPSHSPKPSMGCWMAAVPTCLPCPFGPVSKHRSTREEGDRRGGPRRCISSTCQLEDPHTL